MFKQPISKYKNANAKIVKKEQSISGLSTNRLLNSIGSLINCSLNYVAFAYDTTNGGSICAIKHEDLNRKTTFANEGFTTLQCHSGPMTDIQFNPFNGSILATSAYDPQINLWQLSSGDKVEVNSVSRCMLSESRCDCIQWNPNVENILASVSLSTLYLWDAEYNSIVNTYRNHSDAIQSISWKRDGSLMISAAKDKTMQIFDPRNSSKDILRIENDKTNNKDSRVTWIGDSNIVLSSVYKNSHQRRLYLWDVRNTAAPCNDTDIDVGNNVLNPLLDVDTGMLFLIGKAETAVRYCEVSTDNMNIALNSTQSIDEQIKSACMIPKFGLDLMKCEIDRLVMLTRTSVFPLPYYIPRRSYYEFHADVFPETFSFTANLHKSDWLTGENGSVTKTALNPESQKQYNPSSNSPTSSSSLTTSTSSTSSSSSMKTSEAIISTPKIEPVESKPVVNISISESPFVKPQVPPPITITKQSSVEDNKLVRRNSNSENESNTPNSAKKENAGEQPQIQFRFRKQQNLTDQTNTTTNTPNRITKAKSIYYQSKFKYIQGKAAHKSEHITNIRNLSTMWPSECNGFQVNSKYAAFILSGNSGNIGIVALSKPGRLPDTAINCIINKTKLSDFAFDPFDDDVIAVACDDGVIRVWTIPEDGLTESLTEPDVELKGHTERLYCIKYHPYAKNVIASASYDRTIKLWNIETAEAVKSLTGNTDLLFSMCWSPCGNKLATICKDGFVRVYEPLVSEQPVLQSKVGPAAGSKAARIEWALNGTHLFISGFAKGNSRQIFLLNGDDLSQVACEDISCSPSLLLPFFDPDTNVVYLFAKGEETVYLYEIQEDAPYFQVLSPYKPDGLHYALAFLPKHYCDIKSVEINKAYRLTKDNRIEAISFTVPRTKQSFFQDDIFPDTVFRGQPYLQADEWFNSKSFELRYISLKPDDMQNLTEFQAQEEQKPVVAKPKPVIKGSGGSGWTSNMLDANSFGSEEQKIINTMLQRASLYKEPDTDSDSENDDWN